jgi:peptide deformylase
LAVRPIVKYGTNVLHAPAVPVHEIDAATRTLLDDMVDTMWAAPGIGLAAPQVGVAQRVIVVDLSVGRDPSQLICLVNPEFVLQEGEQRHEEGCLSVPGFGGSPIRPQRVVVKGLGRDGKVQVHEGTDLLARAFCHEIDHIDGLLFVDRLSPLKRDLMKRKLKKRVRDGEWEE